jgi:hypothetical protein
VGSEGSELGDAVHPPYALDLALDRVRFPSRCAECGAPPTRTYALAVEQQGRRTALQVPLCERCGERKSLGLLAWAAGALAVGVALAVVGAMIGDWLVPLVPGLRHAAAPIAIALLALALVPPAWALRRGRTRFHRRFSPVWIDTPASGEGVVTLRFRRAELRGDVARLAGLSLAPDPYRSATAPTARAFAGGIVNPVPGWAVVLVGLGVAAAGVAEFVKLGEDEARARTIRGPWIEIWVYQLGGRWAVLALLLAIGGFVLWMGFSILRAAWRRGDASHQGSPGDER